MYVKLSNTCEECKQESVWENGNIIKGRVSDLDADFLTSFKANGLGIERIHIYIRRKPR